jgi:N-hydroxyarylamine O-acetyltransferase
MPVTMNALPSKGERLAFRVAQPHPGDFHMQKLSRDGYVSLYKFELARYVQADCELGHFFSHQHPDAVFVNNLVVSRITDGEIRSLRNREYWLLGETGEEKELIEEVGQLHTILTDGFDLRVTEAESIHLFDNLPG